jgi:hypothetical protein
MARPVIHAAHDDGDEREEEEGRFFVEDALH